MLRLAHLMLFSVLLPTHNGLEFLRHAVESVRRQDDPDWELVISDNDSADDIEGFVEALGEDRIRYVKTAGFVPVTDNWNNALRHSTGEYVVMLGDDDALLPGYFSALRKLIEEFERPDAIYLGALLYAYPGVLPSAPDGFLKPKLSAPFFAAADAPFLLDPEQARRLARDAMDFRARYDFNMQYVALARETVRRLAGEGEFFRSPYPDFYAMNHVFARASRIVVDPQARVIVGITPTSHGFFYFNHRESEAQAILNTDGVEPEIRRDLAPIVLPGTSFNTSWLLSMELLSRRLGSPADMRPNYGRYRRLQVLHCEQAYHLHRTITRQELAVAEASLTPFGRLVMRALGPIVGTALRTAPRNLRNGIGAIYDRVVGQFSGGSVLPDPEPGRYRDIIDVFEQVRPETYKARQEA